MDFSKLLIILFIFGLSACEKENATPGAVTVEDASPGIAGQQPRGQQQNGGGAMQRTEVETPIYSMAVKTIADVPKCDKDRDRQLIYVIEDKKFLTCNSSAWAEITIAGEQGLPGPKGAQGEQGIPGPIGAGAPGPRGPAGGSGLMVYDGDNTVLGQLVSTVNPYNGQPGSLTIYDQLYGLQYVLNPNGGMVSPTNSKTYFGNADCTGQKSAYADNYQSSGLFSFFWEDTIVEMTSLAPSVSKSFRDNSGTCYRVLGADSFGMASNLYPGGFDFTLNGSTTHAAEIIGTSVVYRYCASNCRRPSDWSEVTIYNGNAYNPAVVVEGSHVSIAFSGYVGSSATSRIMRAHCAANCTTGSNWTIDELESVGDQVGSVDYSIDGANHLIAYVKQGQSTRTLQVLMCSGSCDDAANWNGATVSQSSEGIHGIRTDQSSGIWAIQYVYSDRIYHSFCSAGCGSSENWSTAEVAHTPDTGGFVWNHPVPLAHTAGTFYTVFVRKLGINSNGTSHALIVAACDSSCRANGSWQETQIAVGQNWWQQVPELKVFSGQLQVFYGEVSAQDTYLNSIIATCASNCTVPENWSHISLGDKLNSAGHGDGRWQLEASADKSAMVWFSVNGDRYAECTANCDTAEGWYGTGYADSRTYPIQASNKIQSDYKGPLRLGDIQ